MITSLQRLADLEETCLDRMAGEVLAEVNVDATIKEDDPANVG